MGTDIHAIVQRREGDRWVNVDMTYPGRERWDHPLTGRHYDAFEILANVRNGVGFAGVYTSDGFDPISDNRGFPRDFTDVGEDGYVRCEAHRSKPDVLARVDDDNFEDPAWDCYDCQWMGDHSFTWVTLRELVEYDWAAPVRKRMVVEWPEYHEWAILGDKEGFPKSWCGDVSGGRVVKFREKDIVPFTANVQRVIDRQLNNGMSVYVESFHTYPRSETARDLHNKAIPWLQTFGDPDDVRIVMGFDS